MKPNHLSARGISAVPLHRHLPRRGLSAISRRTNAKMSWRQHRTDRFSRTERRTQQRQAPGRHGCANSTPACAACPNRRAESPRDAGDTFARTRGTQSTHSKRPELRGAIKKPRRFGISGALEAHHECTLNPEIALSLVHMSKALSLGESLNSPGKTDFSANSRRQGLRNIHALFELSNKKKKMSRSNGV